jgi:hypothetical protein
MCNEICEVCKKAPSEMLYIQYGKATWMCSPECLTVFLNEDKPQAELFPDEPEAT